jgi:transposase-like protein
MTITADVTGTPIEATPSRAYAGALGRLYEGAAESFARPTSTVVHRGHAPHGSLGTRAATIVDPEVIADLADAPELRAIEELRAWLRLSYEDVARAAGLSGASLLHHWRQRYRTGSPVRPRAATVEQLWRVHALVRAVAEALEGADQSYAVGLWARRAEHGVTPLELLLAGSVDEVERRAAALLFDHSARPAPFWRVAGAESDDELGPAEAPPPPEYQDSDFG